MAAKRGDARALIWTRRAIGNLRAIGDRIAVDDPRAALRWVDGLIALGERTLAFPLAGRCVPEIGRDDVREVLKRTYRLVYRVRPDRIEILTVFEGHQRLPISIADDD